MTNQDTPKMKTAAAKPPALRELDDAMAHILAKDQFARDRHYFLVRICLGQLAAVCVLTILVVLLALRPVQNHYFLTDPTGKLTPIIAVSNPIDSDSVVAQWVLNSVNQVYSYDFSNYHDQLEAASGNFTHQGWLGFRDALKTSGALQSVIDNKYAVSAVATASPILQNPPSNINGVYTWVFQFPITITYESAVQKTSNTYTATITVVRVPETVNPRGLGINSIILQ